MAGKLAVAHVVKNRVESWQFPNTYCDVIHETKEWRTSWTGNVIPKLGMCQFSWFCDGKSDEPKDSKTWEECLSIAQSFIKEPNAIDITQGAMWYHADYILPYWAEHLNETVYINNHITNEYEYKTMGSVGYWLGQHYDKIKREQGTLSRVY